ncbi:hypothetical protein AVEN_210468-1 [Araneus ventricosus]|uniref:Uncharacterized protein n=1 Tax=Araneus ventricosus TaxID=182803 RepID=A0A4Y2HSK1_ARAVE|nr:hypothetical protein AVEN_210468-1 [Araneus ventricosus]
MMRKTPELDSPLPTSTLYLRYSVCSLHMIQRATGPINGGVLVESGFEPGDLRPRSRDLTTCPSWQHLQLQVSLHPHISLLVSHLQASS